MLFMYLATFHHNFITLSIIKNVSDSHIAGLTLSLWWGIWQDLWIRLSASSWYWSAFATGSPPLIFYDFQEHVQVILISFIDLIPSLSIYQFSVFWVWLVPIVSTYRWGHIASPIFLSITAPFGSPPAPQWHISLELNTTCTLSHMYTVLQRSSKPPSWTRVTLDQQGNTTTAIVSTVQEWGGIVLIVLLNFIQHSCPHPFSYYQLGHQLQQKNAYWSSKTQQQNHLIHPVIQQCNDSLNCRLIF